LSIESQPYTDNYFVGRTKVPGTMYSFEYRGYRFVMHKPMRPSGLFYGPGWMFSISGVPVCVIMNMDASNALAEFERLSELLGDRFEPKLRETMARNGKKVR